MLKYAGTPLSLNFVGEFLSLFGSFSRLPLLGAFACSSIVLSAAYTIYMANKTIFGGTYSKFFLINIKDITHREFISLFILIFFTIILGIYPNIILDGLNFNVSQLIYT
jgi:NADH-ubiquinone oxidoreductase chain 4